MQTHIWYNVSYTYTWEYTSLSPKDTWISLKKTIKYFIKYLCIVLSCVTELTFISPFQVQLFVFTTMVVLFNPCLTIIEIKFIFCKFYFQWYILKIKYFIRKFKFFLLLITYYTKIQYSKLHFLPQRKKNSFSWLSNMDLIKWFGKPWKIKTTKSLE